MYLNYYRYLLLNKSKLQVSADDPTFIAENLEELSLENSISGNVVICKRHAGQRQFTVGRGEIEVVKISPKKKSRSKNKT